MSNNATAGYLTEVSYIDGIAEFETLLWETEYKQITTTGSEEYLTTLPLSLGYDVADFNSILLSVEGKNELALRAREQDGQYKNQIEVYTDDVLTVGDTLKITYLRVLISPSNLYSVDYENGVLYLSAPSNTDLEVSYEYFNTFMTGDYAEQLNPEEYELSEGSNTVELKKLEDNLEHLVVYEIATTLETPTISPYISNAKINYVNTQDEESLP